MIVVVKIGTSSLTDDDSRIDEAAIAKLCDEVARARESGHDVVIVTSGAIAAGLPAMGYVRERPRDVITLQAASAVGQSRLLRAYDDALSKHDLIGGQILLTPHYFFERRQYLHARDTLSRLIQLGIVPIVNENDTLADEEIRFGDNDRIAALVAHAVGAELLLLLTDMDGVYTADPRFDSTASLIHEVIEVDKALEAAAGRSGTTKGSGGMASKIAAARMASWSGIRTVIAAATRPSILLDGIAGQPGIGTVVHPRPQRLSARKMWIAFAVASKGTIQVDNGARKALVEGGKSLLAAGVRAVTGVFDSDSAVEIVDESREVFAKGLCRYDAWQLREVCGLKTDELSDEMPREVVHRDDLVVLI